MWQAWKVPLVFQSATFTQVHASAQCDPRTGFLCDSKCIFCDASLGFVPDLNSCTCSCPLGYSQCAGKCVSACPGTFALGEDCECVCGEGGISMWIFRYLNISSQFPVASPNNGYDITKGIGISEVFVFDENGTYLRPVSCVASSYQPSSPCSNLYDTTSNPTVFLTPLDNLSLAGKEWRTTTAGYGWVTLDFGTQIVASLISIQNSYFGMKNVEVTGSPSDGWAYQVANITSLAQNTTTFYFDRPPASSAHQSALQCVVCPNRNPNITGSLQITSVAPFTTLSDCFCLGNLTYSLTRYGCFNIDAPVINPPSGEYWAKPPIAVAALFPAGITEGTFYYTTNGLMPTEDSPIFQNEWTPPIGSSVLQVILAVPGRELSDVARVEYQLYMSIVLLYDHARYSIVTDLVVNMTSIPAIPGVLFESSFEITINCSTNAPDTTIYYAIQSNASVTKSNEVFNYMAYVNPINVTAGNGSIEEIFVFGYCYANNRNSSVANVSLVVYPVIPEVTFSPANDSFSDGAIISLNCNMEHTTIRYLVSSPNDPVKDFTANSVLYNASEPLQLSCTIDEGDLCYRTISAQAYTWWGNSTTFQDPSIHLTARLVKRLPDYSLINTVEIEFSRLAPIITLRADDLYAGVYVTISIGVYSPTSFAIYYLIDSSEAVEAVNGKLYNGTFLYNQLGPHFISAVAFFGSLISAQAGPLSFVITEVSPPPVILPMFANTSGYISVNVTIQPTDTLTAGGIIRYRINGTADLNSSIYNGSFAVYPPYSTDSTMWNVSVSAIVAEPTKAPSAVTNTIVPKCDCPQASPEPGNYYYQVSVSIACLEGCYARFTKAPDPQPTVLSEQYGTPRTFYNDSGEYNNVTLTAICTHPIYDTSDPTVFQYLVYSKRRPNPPSITFVDDPSSSTQVTIASNLTDPTTCIPHYTPNDYNISLFTNTYYFPFAPSRGPITVYAITNLLPGSTYDAPSLQSVESMQVPTIQPYNASVHTPISISVTTAQTGVVIFYCLTITVSPQQAPACSPSSVSIYSSPVSLDSSALFCIRAAGNYFYSDLNSSCSYYDFDGKDGSGGSQDSSKNPALDFSGSGVGWLILVLLIPIAGLIALGYIAYRRYRAYRQRRFIKEQLDNGFDIMQDDF